MGELDVHEKIAIEYVLYGSSGLSLIGCLFIIITYILFKQTRSYGTTLIFYLSIADFFGALSWFPWAVDDDLCLLQASMMQFFSIASCLWTLAISLSLFQVFLLERDEQQSKISTIIYHLFNWGFPLFSVIICLYHNRFGKAGPWCWIADPRDLHRLWVYGPMSFVCLFICFTFVAIRIKTSSIQSDFKTALNRRLLLYFVAYLITALPAIINRLQNYIAPDNPVFVLFFLQALLQPAQGFFNMIVYGITESHFVDHYAEVFKNGCCCRCRTKRKENNRDSVNGDEIPIFNYDYTSDEE